MFGQLWVPLLNLVLMSPCKPASGLATPTISEANLFYEARAAAHIILREKKEREKKKAGTIPHFTVFRCKASQSFFDMRLLKITHP